MFFFSLLFLLFFLPWNHSETLFVLSRSSKTCTDKIIWFAAEWNEIRSLVYYLDLSLIHTGSQFWFSVRARINFSVLGELFGDFMGTKWLARKKKNINFIITHIISFGFLIWYISWTNRKKNSHTNKHLIKFDIYIFISISDDQAVSHLQRNSDNVINNSSDKVKISFHCAIFRKW